MKKSIFIALSIMLIAYSSWATETTVIGGGGGVSEGSDVDFGNVTATSITVDQGSAASPSVALGDGDTGLYESTDDVLGITIAGIAKYFFLDDLLRGGVGGSVGLRNELATATNPIYTFSTDEHSGVGGLVHTYVSLIVESIETFRTYTSYSEFYPSGTGQVRVYDNGDITTDGSINAAIQVYADLSNTVDQVFVGTGTGYALLFNSNDNLVGITHSTSSDTENITIVTSGVYSITAQPQVTAGAAGDFHMWLQIDTGGGFADVANSNVKLTMANNTEDVIPLILTLPFDAGDKFRLMGSVTDTAIILDAEAPGGEPVIPAIILSMHKL